MSIQTTVKYRYDIHPCEGCGEEENRNIDTVMRWGRNQFLCEDCHLAARKEGTALGAVKEFTLDAEPRNAGGRRE